MEAILNDALVRLLLTIMAIHAGVGTVVWGIILGVVWWRSRSWLR